ncbi:Sec-independent protein translocase protein TatB [Fundidesulfovibrio magnetotacticus]|uniref:Multifunctional fusion protein n=1 Tax=Fundidesulfovibrio magnetotacticus TaxID=2730080 RepID=A0A6V8LNU0_9BACT|nr:Sec-independent protein translocase protein TatB [Fundidesulfovibrio magnetotacticus]GFK94262.1 Sec-independent protein translocase protein TatB [Fundidesulfovibrio magnetotacticus]
MFGIGSTELVIILIVALVLIGPSKLPDLMKSLGKGISEFRRMSTDVKSTLEREIEKADEAKRIEETKKELFGDAAPSEADAGKPAQSPVETAAKPGADDKAAPTAAAADATKTASAQSAEAKPAAEAKTGAPAATAQTAAAAPADAAKESGRA